MTIDNTTNEVFRTVPVAIPTSVTFPMRFFADTDITVIDNGTLKTLSTDYTLTGAGVDADGTLTTVTAFSNVTNGTRIIRQMPKTQLTDYAQTGAFDAESHEDALDKLTILSQGSMSRDTTSAETWDAESDKIVNVTDPTAAQDAATKNYVDGAISGQGNVVAPVSADIGFHYEATAVGEHAWRNFDEIIAPTASQVTRKSRTLIQANSETLGSHGAFVELETPSENWIYNSDFSVAQKGTTFTSGTVPINNDGNILLDRWVFLADGSDTCDVFQSAVVPEGAFASVLLEVETANRKFGILQILENRDTLRLLRDGSNASGDTTVVSLSFEARTTSNTIGNLRAAVMSWVGTADSPTRDVVSAWGNEGTNPTLVTSWAFENTPADLVLANVFDTASSRHTINNISLNTASTNNIAVFIWVDDTDALVGDVVYISKVKLERGDIDTPYQATTFADELLRSQRYWQQSYAQGVAPGTVTAVNERVAVSGGVGAGDATIQVGRTVVMRITPTTVIYNPAVSNTTGQMREGSNNPAASVTGNGDSSFRIENDGAITDGAQHRAHFTADAEL